MVKFYYIIIITINGKHLVYFATVLFSFFFHISNVMHTVSAQC